MEDNNVYIFCIYKFFILKLFYVINPPAFPKELKIALFLLNNRLYFKFIAIAGYILNKAVFFKQLPTLIF